jgi:prepilin-type N-terminal cleavage/methylation domain-containing protein
MIHYNLDKPTIDDSPSAHRRDAGFTLLEIIVSLVLLSLLTAIFGMGLVAAVQSHEFNRSNVDLTQKSQLAMTRIQRELMELIRVTEVTDDQTTMGIKRLVIYERMVSGNNQSTVRFGLHYNPGDKSLYLYTNLAGNATQLDDLTIGQGDVLIDGVENITFECFKGDITGAETWNEKTDEQPLLSTIRVTLDLKRRDDPETIQRLRTVVHMRNNDNTGGIPPPPATVPSTQNDYSCFISSVAQTIPRCRPVAEVLYRKVVR